MSECLVCGTPSEVRNSGTVGYTILCPRCGEFYLDPQAAQKIERELAQREAPDKSLLRRVMSHGIRYMARDSKQYRYPTVSILVVDELLRRKAPTPHEQSDNVVKWIGLRINSPEERYKLPFPELGAIVGTKIEDSSANAADYFLKHMEKVGLITY